MEKILTVIVPAYNVEKYLGETLNTMCSIKNLDDIEILVVNDGSTDNTSKIAEEYRDKYPNSVVLINKENGGHGSTINTGVKVATGKYFKVIDGDDWVDTLAFENFVNQIKNLNADMILTPFRKVYVDTVDSEEVTPEVTLAETDYKLCEYIDLLAEFYCMHSITFRTDVYKKTKLNLTEKCFYVDMEFILYPIDEIDTFHYLNLCIYQYRLGRPGQSVAMASKIKNKEMHKRVIHDLADNCSVKKRNNSNSVDRYVISKLVTLSNIQYSIYLSMEQNRKTYGELLEFKSYIESVIDKAHFNGVSKIIHLFPMSYWILGCRYRRKYSA